MIIRSHRRQRNRRQVDPADPPSPPTAAPIGPAGGDLGESYPNPTVVSLAHVSAGGDLGGAMDAPTVRSLAHVTIGPATYPAGDGSLLTNVPAPATLKSGSDVLDSSGSLDLSAIITSGYFVAMFNTTSGIGPLTFQSAPYRIVSAVGSADAGKGVVWIAY